MLCCSARCRDIGGLFIGICVVAIGSEMGGGGSVSGSRKSEKVKGGRVSKVAQVHGRVWVLWRFFPFSFRSLASWWCGGVLW